MASSEDTEITLGTGKLLVLFFGLVAVCAVFFALGYSLGRKSEPALTSASAAIPAQAASSKGTSATAPAQAPMTFYKSVEQKDANPQLTPPATDAKTDSTAAQANPGGTATVPGQGTPAQATPGQAPGQSSEPVGLVPTSGYFVQVAAVVKQEDADALVDVLKKKDYAAFVAPATADKLMRVQVGPFADIKDAEAVRKRLIDDGYNPIVKK